MSGTCILMMLIALQAWRRRGGRTLLALAGMAGIAAPLVWSGGYAAGPTALAYLWHAGRKASRLAACGMLAVSIALGLGAWRLVGPGNGTAAESAKPRGLLKVCLPGRAAAKIQDSATLRQQKVTHRLTVEPVHGALKNRVLDVEGHDRVLLVHDHRLRHPRAGRRSRARDGAAVRSRVAIRRNQAAGSTSSWCTLEMETAENIRRGMDPDAARRKALLASGGLTAAAEAVTGAARRPVARERRRRRHLRGLGAAT